MRSRVCSRAWRTGCAKKLSQSLQVSEQEQGGPMTLTDLRRAHLGHAPGRPCRPHRLGLADPPLHRPGGPLQVRAGQRLRAGAGRAALRHVRGRVHARGRPLHLRGAAEPRRPRRPGAAAPSARSSTTSTSRTASSGARRRPASRTLIAGHRARRRDDERAARARQRRVRRPLRVLPQEARLRRLYGRDSSSRHGPARTEPSHGVTFGEAFWVWARVAALSLRRPGGPDRGHAPHPGRGEALDRREPVPARAELLHAAARPRGAAARRPTSAG